MMYLTGCLESPPSRRRGLKTASVVITVEDKAVASFAEAWIENRMELLMFLRYKVASFAEAWIENTFGEFLPVSYLTSPPSRRRGLKTCTLFVF